MMKCRFCANISRRQYGHFQLVERRQSPCVDRIPDNAASSLCIKGQCIAWLAVSWPVPHGLGLADEPECRPVHSERPAVRWQKGSSSVPSRQFLSTVGRRCGIDPVSIWPGRRNAPVRSIAGRVAEAAHRGILRPASVPGTAAPVAQMDRASPPKGKVTRSNRVRGTIQNRT